jgi:hypothetical protein
MRKKEEYVSQEMKDILMDVGVTLNGKRAYIIGRCNPCATIITRDGSERYEWSWVSARRIVAHNGEFKS